ncbi:c-type cytochrome [Alcaligenaceae bacterium]|nr:c-type cytochrome [Alcaligenaceae bacterium]
MYSRVFIAALCMAGWALAAPVSAQTAGVDLARSNNCLACHQVDQKRVGPAFAKIGERFAGQEGAIAYLATAIREGSRSRWGAVPMPAQPQVSPANAQLIAAWILSLGEQSQPSIK